MRPSGRPAGGEIEGAPFALAEKVAALKWIGRDGRQTAAASLGDELERIRATGARQLPADAK